MRFWFVPVWSGDFRLERVDDTHCKLTVEDPTEADRKLLKPFLDTAKDREWFRRMPTVKLIGLTEVLLDVRIQEAGPLLVDHTHEDGETWTAVRYGTGKVTVLDGNGERELAALPAKQGEQKPAETEPEPVAAATVRQPQRGCPAPSAAERRSSQVLRTFSTTAQWRSWTTRGVMRLTGNTTGRAYNLWHRNEANRRGLRHLLQVAATGGDVCVWDERVPPEEEALAIMLAVEHRERWLVT